MIVCSLPIKGRVRVGYLKSIPPPGPLPRGGGININT